MRFKLGFGLLLLAATAYAEPLMMPSDSGAISVTTSVAGDDLSIAAEFEQPVKGLLTADDPFLSLDLFFDTDNKAETGFAQADDARKGADYSVMVILRLQSKDGPQGKPEEVIVVKEGTVGTVVNANPKLLVDGKRIQVLMPLSAMGLRKGQTIRVAGFCGGNDPVDKTITLEAAEPAAKSRKGE